MAFLTTVKRWTFSEAEHRRSMEAIPERIRLIEEDNEEIEGLLETTQKLSKLLNPTPSMQVRSSKRTPFDGIETDTRKVGYWGNYMEGEISPTLRKTLFPGGIVLITLGMMMITLGVFFWLYFAGKVDPVTQQTVGGNSMLENLGIALIPMGVLTAFFLGTTLLRVASIKEYKTREPEDVFLNYQPPRVR